MPTPESSAHAKDKYLIHAVAVAVGINSEQAIQLLFWQPDLIQKMQYGLLPPKHVEITQLLMQTTSDYLARRTISGGRAQQRKKMAIDRQLIEDLDDESDYSKMEGGALGLTTGPSAAQLWMEDPHPQLLEFLQKQAAQVN